MNEVYITNRDLITNFSLNTGTTQAPVWTKLCTTSELTLNQSFEEKSWSVFCDALTRSINTGVEMTLEGTIKIDANNTAITNIGPSNITTMLHVFRNMSLKLFFIK